MALSDNVDSMQRAFNTVISKLTKRNNAIKDVASTLKEHTDKLKREINIYKSFFGSIDKRRGGTTIRT
ncbi:hypothetical protein J1N35_013885 [Gossypium stocksii]|uniref:Uncharacterized protein n=1 Tax=Gossypium stocksii TaxID=47602 RepID=A0A9D4A8S9_9ROSI|nr:hypothetical protein J1N35_013885 [Gossypium stocksii]